MQTFARDQGDRSLIFFSKKFVNSHNKLYLCSVFHSIRFKVNKGLELSGAPFFYIYTYSIYYNKNSPTASQWQRNVVVKSNLNNTLINLNQNPMRIISMGIIKEKIL